MKARLADMLVPLPFALLLFILPFPGTVALRLLCLSLAFVLAVHGWKRWATPDLPCKPALWAWAAIALASLAYAVDPAYSLGEIKNELGYTMMAFAAFFAATRTRSRLQLWALAVLAAALVISIWGLITSHGRPYWDDSAAHGGVGSFASLAVVALPLGLLLWQRPGRAGRVALLAAGLVILAAAAVTQQRILWMAFGVQLAAMLGLFRYGGLLRLRAWVMAVFVAASLALGGAAVLLVHAKKVEHSDAEYQDMGRDFRLQQWHKIAARIMEKPWTGAGFGRESMKKAYPDLIPDTPPLSLMWHPHNVFLTYGVGMGIPGMLALALVFAALAAAYAGHVRASQPERRLVAIAGIAIVAGVITRNMTNDLFLRDGALMFWALNGGLLGWLSRPPVEAA